MSDTFRQFNPPPSGDALAVWRDWFAAHGIDPDTVAFHGVEVHPVTWVERRANPGQSQIVYLMPGQDSGGTPIVVERTVDLDEPPAPFPVP